jgi:hypothetical protein
MEGGLNQANHTNVNNRVAGMVRRYVLSGHDGAVTAIICFPFGGEHWMVCFVACFLIAS